MLGEVVLTGTYGNLVERLVAKCVIDLVLPTAFYPGVNILVGDVPDLSYVVIAWVVLEDDSYNLVLGSSQPTFFKILENDLQTSLGAGYEARICNRDVEGA